MAPDKGMDDLKKAAPELARRLMLQAKSFHRMPCEMHARMRMGPAAPAEKSEEE